MVISILNSYSLLPILLARMGKRTPVEVFHEISFTCNLRCKYCGLPKNANKIRAMNTNQIKQAIKEFSDAGTRVWNFTGGEPLLRKDIGELINYAKDCGILFITLTTNGILFKNFFKELKNLDKIFFSLDGPKEVHDNTKGKGTYEKVVEAIRLAKKEDFNVTVQTTICKENTENNFFGLKYLFNLAKELDVRIIFHPIYNHSYGNINIHISPEKNIEALKLIKRYKKKSKHISRADATYDEWIRRFNGKKTNIKSYAGMLYCHLLPDGKISPCFFGKESYDGLKHGFLNAFRSLSILHNCNCISFFTDRDLLYSLNFDVIKTLLSK